MLKQLLCFFVLLLSGAALLASETGDLVVVVYNSLMPQSKDVAEHYAAARHVPTEHLLGLELPNTETITRTQFNDELAKPFLKWLEQKHFLTFKLDATATNAAPFWRVRDATIRYAVLCYGVPLRIAHDDSIHETVDQIPAAARSNGAAVDSELTMLPLENLKLPLSGPLRNPFLAISNAPDMNPINGILLVARLDGPTPEIARKLVDKAIQAETDGLWGRAYFDSRGSSNEYKQGDDLMRAGATAARQSGFETIIDEKPETFPATFPMSQIALYGGWYDANVSGPFALPSVEFMPGAVAYHLHSFSAATLRSTNSHWVGPFLAKGVTATLGCIDEPFVSGTPDVGVFYHRLLHGFSFGEAAWAAAPVVSWQTTVVGDPLYRPFGKHPREQHEFLAAQKNPLIEWSHLRVANLNLVQGYPASEVITYLLMQGKDSAVLTEKLADLYSSEGKDELALQSYKRALSLNPSPLQQRRLKTILAEKLSAAATREDKSAK